jgi:hypothetical protein
MFVAGWDLTKTGHVGKQLLI